MRRLLTAALMVAMLHPPTASAATTVGGTVTAGAAGGPSTRVALSDALAAARRGDVSDAQRRKASLRDRVERKLVDWTLADAAAARLPLDDLSTLSLELQGWPGEAARRAALARRQDQVGTAPMASARAVPPARDYAQRRRRMGEALRRGDLRTAYRAVRGHAERPGSVAFAELESFAGWLALRQGDPAAAEVHFARLAAAVRSPVSKARAAYWRGRAASRAGDPIGAQLFYAEGARYPTTFYGQLAAQRAGVTDLVLAPDPSPTPAQRAAFANDEVNQALQRLAAAGERDFVRVFALHQGRRATSAAELALLVDMLRGLNETEVALLAYRKGAWSGHVLYDRGYPVLSPPLVTGGADPALVLAITRQESQFDPRVRSGAGARGMMQILPSTGRQVARRLGLPWREGLLWDPTANLRLGSRYLGELSARFGGSIVLAAAGYNAGPGRPAQWVGVCGDPRSPRADPLDFIECIPFGETRDYVMNVMANYQVYRARLNGGRAALTAAETLRSGASGPGSGRD